MKSELFKLNWRDALKGLIVAILTALLTGIVNILQTGAFPTLSDFQSIGMIALTAGASYLLKNFLTSSDDKILSKEGQ